MVDELANLQITEDEDDPVCDQEYGEEIDDEFKLCLVGKVLTNNAVHFPSMRTVLRKLWHPLEGLLITKMEDKRVLFQFYNELDLKRVTDGTPWFFNKHLIIFHRMERGEDPVQVLLVFSNFWVQVHNLPLGSMSERMARQLENFMGRKEVLEGCNRDMKGVDIEMGTNDNKDEEEPLATLKSFDKSICGTLRSVAKNATNDSVANFSGVLRNKRR
ncbi:hypothetical protein Goari_027455 [Gossypium aridum]|uniref:DUF4283 domain-containing protein n=1 Tax=Gossypium aridum TaxID=34290 RepID=A0A7J8YPP1_GOSAI|nr:hypothetical protein [Gossypium aridum]